MKTVINDHLALVLSYGSLHTLTFDQVFNELKDSYADESNKHLYTFDQAYNMLLSDSKIGLCYEFIPYNDNNPLDLCRTRTWCKDSAIFISGIYAEIRFSLK